MRVIAVPKSGLGNSYSFTRVKEISIEVIEGITYAVLHYTGGNFYPTYVPVDDYDLYDKNLEKIKPNGY